MSFAVKIYESCELKAGYHPAFNFYVNSVSWAVKIRLISRMLVRSHKHFPSVGKVVGSGMTERDCGFRFVVLRFVAEQFFVRVIGKLVLDARTVEPRPGGFFDSIRFLFISKKGSRHKLQKEDAEETQ